MPSPIQNIVVAVVWSPGKNYASLPARQRRRADQQQASTRRRRSTTTRVFVWHDLRPAGATGGEFDDLMVVDSGRPALRPDDRGGRAALSRPSGQREADFAVAVGFQRQAIAARFGLARRLVQADAQARCASSPARAAARRRSPRASPRRCRRRAARRARRIRARRARAASASPARLASALRIRLSATLSNSERGSRAPRRRRAPARIPRLRRGTGARALPTRLARRRRCSPPSCGRCSFSSVSARRCAMSGSWRRISACSCARVARPRRAPPPRSARSATAAGS